MLGVVVGARRQVDDRDAEGADAESGGRFVELDPLEEAVDHVDVLDLRMGQVGHCADATRKRHRGAAL